MNNCDPCNSCNSECGGCKPACSRAYFNLQADPFSTSHWLWEMGCENGRIKIPTIPIECPKLSINYSNSTLNLTQGSCDPQILTGAQLGSIVTFDDLRDVDVSDAEACAFPVYNPGCGLCPCAPDEKMWKAYTIPDAGDCVLEPTDDGYYKVLKKNDCGCIVECRMPVVPNGMVSLNYQRDSVPDDPDFPWYYGCYNDTINLHLEDNAAQYFGKYALKVTINYGVQAIKSDRFDFNYNWRSLLVPAVEDGTLRTDMEASILQTWAMAATNIPWGTSSLRGSFSFIVPKGKEASLHHEYRIRTTDSFPRYKFNSTYDGKRVPDSEATLNSALWPASRLNALQVIIEPTAGSTDYDPVKDEYRSQLDDPEDSYPVSWE